MKGKKLNIFDKIFIIYIIVLFFSLLISFQFSSLIPDEGTHLLLSSFYKDLASNIIQTWDFSFQNAYQYGINYLIHYPKLQIAYPPLFHFTTAFLYYPLLGASEMAGRLSNLIYATLAFVIFFIITRKYFDSKTALMATVFFSFWPFSLYFSSRVLIDFTAFFWILVSVVFFIFALENKRTRFFALAGFLTFLATMGKQMGAFLILFFLFCSVWKKQNLKNILVLLLCFSMPLIPYLFVLNKAGGFEINMLVAVDAAAVQGESLSMSDTAYWTYYITRPIIYMPFTAVFFLAFFFYVYKKEKYWKEFLLWFLIFFVCLSVIPNKATRFYQFFALPFYVIAAHYLAKIESKAAILAVFSIYIIWSLVIFLPTIEYQPIKEVSDYIFENIPSGANVVFLSEEGQYFSSSYMFFLAKRDVSKNIFVYRVCTFIGKTGEEVYNFLKKNSVFYVIGDYSVYNDYNILKESLIPIKNFGNIKLFRFKDFESAKTRNCNFICVLNKEVCLENDLVMIK